MSNGVVLVLSLSISGSILTLLLFALKPLFKYRLPKAVQYYAWVLVLLRLLIPFSVKTSVLNYIFYGNGLYELSYEQNTANQPMDEGDGSILGNDKSAPGYDKGSFGDSYSGNVGESNIDNNEEIHSDNSVSGNSSGVGSEGTGSTIDETGSGSLLNLIGRSAGSTLGDMNPYYAGCLLIIWIFGAAVMLSVNLAGYIRFARRIKASNRPALEDERVLFESLLRNRTGYSLDDSRGNSLFNNKSGCSLDYSAEKSLPGNSSGYSSYDSAENALKRQAGRRNIAGWRPKAGIARNPYVSAPMLIGVFRPMVILPDIELDKVQLRNILIHEIVHLRRNDVVLKWLMMAASCLHWFNPLLPFIKKELSRVCELSCDEAAINGLDSRSKQAYGDTLISMAAAGAYPADVLQVTML
jgi:beta-lactamase regulating signal transducer with metallopeptidase domain